MMDSNEKAFSSFKNIFFDLDTVCDNKERSRKIANHEKEILEIIGLLNDNRGWIYLGTILHDERTLRLAVLNACEGALTAVEDPFAGTAQSLILQRIPSVFAMQARTTDSAAITLSQEFYSALADGYPVDAALTEARKVVFAEGYSTEWGTPVLYLCSPDGRIFDIQNDR